MQFPEEKLNKIIRLMIIVTLILTSLYIFSQFDGFISSVGGALSAVLVPFLIAFFINFLIYPLVIYAENKGLRPRWLVVTFIYLIIFTILGVILYLIIPIVAQQVQELFLYKLKNIIETYQEDIRRILSESEKLKNIYDNILLRLSANAELIIQKFATSIPSIFGSIFTIVLTPIILFYYLKDHNEIGEGIYKIVPIKYKEHFFELTKRINQTIGLYIRGQVIIMFGIGVISTLGYTLVGLDYAIVFGIIVGLTNIIPYVGATISAVVPVAYTLITGDVPWYVILLLNFSFQFVEGNILQPVIMSKQLDMHPLVILAAILCFGSLFGVFGVILAVPITGLIKVCIIYYNEVKNKNKNENVGYEV